MAKKIFDTQSATDKFFTQSAHNAQDTQNTQEAPVKKETDKNGSGRGYRYNLLLDSDLNEFLHYAAWRKRESMTQYVNDLLREQMTNYIESCKREGKEPFEGWKD